MLLETCPPNVIIKERSTWNPTLASVKTILKDLYILVGAIVDKCFSWRDNSKNDKYWWFWVLYLPINKQITFELSTELFSFCGWNRDRVAILPYPLWLVWGWYGVKSHFMTANWLAVGCAHNRWWLAESTLLLWQSFHIAAYMLHCGCQSLECQLRFSTADHLLVMWLNWVHLYHHLGELDLNCPEYTIKMFVSKLYLCKLCEPVVWICNFYCAIKYYNVWNAKYKSEIVCNSWGPFSITCILWVWTHFFFIEVAAHLLYLLCLAVL